MFDFFEVPSQMIGAIGPVAQGTDFDWVRQDTKPGLLNLNLIIDEEVFFSLLGKQTYTAGGTDLASGDLDQFNQTLLNFNQIPQITSAGGTFFGGPWTGPLATGYPAFPMVVTSVLSNGSPGFAYPMNNVNVGAMLAYDPVTKTVAPFNVAGSTVVPFNNNMKASFAQFLWLRHGGSGFIFGYGSAAVGQNFSIKPPRDNPNAPVPPNGIPAEIPFHSISYPDIDYTILRPAALPPTTYTDPKVTPSPITPTLPPAYTTATSYNLDPGVRNLSLYQGIATGAAPLSTAAGVRMPPAIPTRRLFQIPDAINATSPSNASEKGDPYINNLTPATAGNPAPGALPPMNASTTVTVNVNNGVASLYWPGTPTPPLALPSGVTNPYLGATTGSTPDNRQHPYFRSEMLQKVMNLTTVRTHQHAVWITIGFFEVKRQGDLMMAGSQFPTLAFDILGPEIGAATGQTTRYRGFFLVDRTKLTGFDDTAPGSFQPAVVYRQMIE